MPTPGSSRKTESSPFARPYVLTTVGGLTLVFFTAFEALAVTTVMPTVARELDGVRLFALSFAAPLASGVVGMVATGWWSDRTGPAKPLLTSIALFVVGLLVCGLAPSMPILVGGRLLQGLGGGGLTVALYVVVGLMYPTRLQAPLFASFAAAWVLPSLVGPSLAALVASVAGWRWVFLGVIALVAVATALIVPGLRRLPPPRRDRRALGVGRLGWAVLAAVAVLTLDLAGESRGGVLFSVAACAVVLGAARPLVPRGTLLARRGLPSVIATRGAMAAGFLSAEAYLPFVLQERWHWSTAAAGAVLAAAGLAWAGGSAVQSRWRDRFTDSRAMRLGSLALCAGLVGALLVVATTAPPGLLVAAYAVAALGMGVAYPRTSIATLSASTDADRGFNSAGLSVSESLGAALALALCGLTFAAASRDPFLAVYGIPVACAALGVLVAFRTRADRSAG